MTQKLFDIDNNSQSLKNFFFWQRAGVFLPDKTFKPYLIFANKAGALQVSSPYKITERLAKDKHSSLLCPSKFAPSKSNIRKYMYNNLSI